MGNFKKWASMAGVSILILFLINCFAWRGLIIKKFVELPYKGITEKIAIATEKRMQDLGYKLTPEEEGWNKGSNLIFRKYRNKDGVFLSIFITTEKMISLRQENGSAVVVEELKIL